MTEDEAIERLATIHHPSGNGDAEGEHAMEDAFLIDAIEAAGWVRLAQAVRETRESFIYWYA